MAQILSGKPVANALCEALREETEKMKENGLLPTLCVVRLGEDPSDLAYEKGIMNRAGTVDVRVVNRVLPVDTDADALAAVLEELSKDDSIHGVLLFRPLPKALRPFETKIIAALDPCKDVDGMTDGSAAGVFLRKPLGFAPCTPSACMEILRYYDIDPAGKHAVVVGRSPVVGRPLSMLLLHKNATVTVCHTKTADLPAMTKQAEILVAAAGCEGMLGEEHIAPGAVVLDVGVNWSETLGRYVGDVRFDELEAASAVTPVPGGVGAVTTAILLRNVVQAAKNQQENI